MKSQIRAPIARKVCCHKTLQLKAETMRSEFEYKNSFELSLLGDSIVEEFTDFEGVYTEVISILCKLPMLESNPNSFNSQAHKGVSNLKILKHVPI